MCPYSGSVRPSILKFTVYMYQFVLWCSYEAMLIIQDNLICLPLKLAQSLGNISQLVLCHRITSSVQLVDPQTTQSKL